jgi:hypothetical protein
MCAMIVQKAADRRPTGGHLVAAAGMDSFLNWPFRPPEVHAVSSRVGLTGATTYLGRYDAVTASGYTAASASIASTVAPSGSL